MGENKKELQLQEKIDDLTEAFLLLNGCHERKKDYLMDQESHYSGHEIDEEAEINAWDLYNEGTS